MTLNPTSTEPESKPFPPDGSVCQLTVEPHFQCCCNCRYHLPVHFHCTTHPKPTDEQKAAQGIEGRCVCGVQKGWACVMPEFGQVFDNWEEHSCGCECYTPVRIIPRPDEP